MKCRDLYVQFYVSGLEGSIFPLHPAQAGLVNNLSVLGGVHQRMATNPRTLCRDFTMREARGPLLPQCELPHPPCAGSRATLYHDSTNHQFAWIFHPSHASGAKVRENRAEDTHMQARCMRHKALFTFFRIPR